MYTFKACYATVFLLFFIVSNLFFHQLCQLIIEVLYKQHAFAKQFLEYAVKHWTEVSTEDCPLIIFTNEDIVQL